MTINKLKKLLSEVPAKGKPFSIHIRAGNCTVWPKKVFLNKLKDSNGDVIEYELVLDLVSNKKEWQEFLDFVDVDTM